MPRPYSILALISLVVLLLPACDSPPPPPPKVDQKQALLERAQLYWDYRVKDFSYCYDLETPDYRETFSLKHYIRTYPGEIMYHNATVIDANIEGNMGTVSVSIKYSYMLVLVKGGLSTMITDHWELYDDGIWYHHLVPPTNKRLPPIDTWNYPVDPRSQPSSALIPSDTGAQNDTRPLIERLAPKESKRERKKPAAEPSGGQ